MRALFDFVKLGVYVGGKAPEFELPEYATRVQVKDRVGGVLNAAVVGELPALALQHKRTHLCFQNWDGSGLIVAASTTSGPIEPLRRYADPEDPMAIWIGGYADQAFLSFAPSQVSAIAQADGALIVNVTFKQRGFVDTESDRLKTKRRRDSLSLLDWYRDRELFSFREVGRATITLIPAPEEPRPLRATSD